MNDAAGDNIHSFKVEANNLKFDSLALSSPLGSQAFLKAARPNSKGPA